MTVPVGEWGSLLYSSNLVLVRLTLCLGQSHAVVHSLQRCGAELLCQCESSSRCCLTLRASTVISGLLRMIQSSLGQRAGTGVTQDKEIQSQALTALAWQLNLSKAIQLLLRAHLTPCGPALSQETLESSASTLWDPEDDPA